MGRPVFPRGLSGTVSLAFFAQDEPSALQCDLCSVTLVQAALPHVGSHQAARGREGPAEGCSTQPGGGLWSQPAVTCISCPGLGLPPCLPPVAWVSCAWSGQTEECGHHLQARLW